MSPLLARFHRKKLQQQLSTPILLMLVSAITALLPAANAQAELLSLPAAQQKPPATLEDRYPYRPACRQLIPQLSQQNPAYIAWGPVIAGSHQNWYGLPAGQDITDALQALETLGFCVQEGDIVPWQAIEPVSDPLLSVASETPRTPMERNIDALQNAPDALNQPDSGFVGFLMIVFLTFGLFHVYERFEDTTLVRRLQGKEPQRQGLSPKRAFASAGVAREAIPDRASTDDLLTAQQRATDPTDTALSILLASPFVSRAIFGFQRSGKTNLVATATRRLQTERDVTVFVMNLSSYGDEDQQYWQDVRCVQGDLVTIVDEQTATTLIQQATTLVEDFINCSQPSLLICDEWTFMAAKHGKFSGLLTPLIEELANKITGLASSGMKRRKAIWTISSSMVAGELEEFGKAVKKLSPCLVAIAPGHTAEWGEETITFSTELYAQVSKNYPGALVEPPPTAIHERIACINGQWLPLGTRALVTAGVPGAAETMAEPSPDMSPTQLPKPLPLSTELQLFRTWLAKKAAEVITYDSFKNASCFKAIGRSKETYLMLCDKAVMKGWLSQQGDDTFFVLD